MKLQQKITAIFFLLLIGVPFGSWYYYRHNRPQYVPPAPRPEVSITIIPGWDLNDLATYLVQQGIASTVGQVFQVAGAPAVMQEPLLQTSSSLFTIKPARLSLEGYLAPETYRIFQDATVAQVIDKLLLQREKQLQESTRADAIIRSGRSVNEILTMASIVEDEAKTPADRKMVADILWRRIGKHWALQVDSSVHYATHKTGTVFTTAKDREINSPWNTYKYPGLPPGPICNPDTDSIDAALNPTSNDYWYFLSGTDGQMHYAKTLDEQTANRLKYLR